ncbi:MAG TPA: glycosyl hydrolase family 18 protein [Polyangiaceae bacterium]|nr:glycosyl hydrolase family 18 protein [Polyangiaceae bacterium]
MKIRSALCAPVLLAAVLLPACSSTPSGESSSSAGSSSAGASASGGQSAGGSTSGTAGGGATAAGGTGGASAGTGGAAAGAGGAPGGGGTGGSAGSSGGSGGTTSTMIPDTKVVMYLPNWSGSFADWASKVDFNKMTHLNLAFGTVNTNNDWSMGAADGDVKTLAAAAHAKNVKILVSIGGADDDIGIINQYHTESNIDPLVANLDAFITRLDLDGVDVDLERGNELQSNGNFPEFLSKIEAKLKPEGKLVTAALAQYIVQDAGTDATTKMWITSYDFVNLMIYSTNMNTYTSELDWWTNNINVPKNKLTWGVEFTNNLSNDMAAQLTTASKAYGGVMVWEYSQGTESRLWPAIQGAL